MRSKKRLAGALALSAVLALGTSSLAFAVDAGTEGSASGSSLSAKTSVTIVTEDESNPTEDQLSVQVPLNVRVVAKPGGGDIAAPDASHYCISNQTNTPIKVTATCELTGVGLDLELVGAADKGAKTGPGVAAPAGRHGALFMQLEPVTSTDGSTWDPDSAAGSAWVVSSALSDDAAWKIGKAGCVNVKISGQTSQLSKLLEVESSAPASLDITYKVAKDASASE